MSAVSSNSTIGFEDRTPIINTSNESLLRWDVHITPKIPIVMAVQPPIGGYTFFQVIAQTLIYGENDAVLIDVCMTSEQAIDLANWIALKGKKLTTIYITHGHGDHWFAVSKLLERFPSAKFVATADTVKVMSANSSQQALDGAWKPGFPGQIPENLKVAEALDSNVIDLEGHDLVIVELGHTDTDSTTCVHVPSIGLVVAGDAAYNGVHAYLAESTVDTRQEWLRALDKIESLHPRVVVASHKRPENSDSPDVIEETRQYIRDFDRLVGTTTSAEDLFYAMLDIYPDMVNPGWALWSSALAVKA